MKLRICLIILLCLLEVMFGRRVIIKTGCGRILHPRSCHMHPRCRWSVGLHECLPRHSLMIGGPRVIAGPGFMGGPRVLHRPYARFGPSPYSMARPMVGGPMVGRPLRHMLRKK